MSEKGSVLVLSLWIVLFLSLFAWSMSRKASLESRLTRYALDDADRESAGRAKALDIARELAGRSQVPPWGYPEGVAEEESRVNVNTLDLEGLTRLFDGHKDVAAAVLDWRDPDDKLTPGGAEKGDYATRLDYVGRNAPFRFPEELLLVKGMTRALYEKALPRLTLWGDGRVNWNGASAETLEILGVPGEDARAVEVFRWGADGTPGTEDDRTVRSSGDLGEVLDRELNLSAEGREVLKGLLLKNRFSFQGQYVRWTGTLAEGKEDGGPEVTMVLAPWLQPGKILSWREGA